MPLLSAFTHGEQPAFHVYRQADIDHSQVGIVGCVSAADAEHGGIVGHERTLPFGVERCLKHLQSRRAQTAPVVLAYRGSAVVDDVIKNVIAANAACRHSIGPDGVVHDLWRVDAASQHGRVLAHALSRIDRFYVIDGHHRIAAACRVSRERPGATGCQVLATAIRASQLRVRPYHRLIRDLGPHSVASFLDALCSAGVLAQTGFAPAGPGEIRVFVGRHWYCWVHSGAAVGGNTMTDVEVLHLSVFERIAGVANDHDPRLSYVSGGPDERSLIERAVRSGASAAGFMVAPPGIRQVMALADVGRLLPPKATWFHPKVHEDLLSLPM